MIRESLQADVFGKHEATSKRTFMNPGSTDCELGRYKKRLQGRNVPI